MEFREIFKIVLYVVIAMLIVDIGIAIAFFGIPLVVGLVAELRKPKNAAQNGEGK